MANNYNRPNLITRILRDRYNVYDLTHLLKLHYSTLLKLKRDNYNRSISDAEEYADDNFDGLDY